MRADGQLADRQTDEQTHYSSQYFAALRERGEGSNKLIEHLYLCGRFFLRLM